MARRLADIKSIVESSADSFLEFLDTKVDKETLRILREIQNVSSVYIFSGVIRNFFIGITEIRDLDIVLSEDVKIESYFKNYHIKRNSFGGYKISKDVISIDIWVGEKSWAFQQQKILDFEIDRYIPSTAFFNFSSILFNLNDNRFYCTKHFLKFIRDKKIDVVYKPNANYELCIVNSFYYSDKYHLKISDNLRAHIIYLYNKNFANYESIQIKHFGEVLYDNATIDSRVNALRLEKAKDKLSIFLTYKQHIDSKPINSLKKNFQNNAVKIAVSIDYEEYSNFTGPEWGDIVLFIKDNILLAPAVYDLFKAGMLQLLIFFRNENKDKAATKILLRYEDEKKRLIELKIEGDHSKEDISHLLDEAMKILATDKKEEIFANPDFVDRFNSRVIMEYNTTTKKWEPFNFEKLRKEWEKIQEEISKLSN